MVVGKKKKKKKNYFLYYYLIFLIKIFFDFDVLIQLKKLFLFLSILNNTTNNYLSIYIFQMSK